ncbi:heterogeneous nuclear ribonucleoprotein 1-like isoform X2 [Phragmites australis]|uniref:heterogeneous nuclear ribonucleoprotein 1-like isoform X2 n=1 Tax=Phragmites australis TaxID=29695 RepID=UPI002D79BBD5|nr:heterogeneous nuclear ribonucleoprotein 1-like isoform X2 [Phragmites australis]
MERPVATKEGARTQGVVAHRETFTKHFQKYGAITDSVIMKDKHTRMPRGFGFVTFSDPSVIDRVLEDEHVIDGRTVEVKRTVPREEMSSKDSHGPKTRKIFVGGIPPSLTEDKLKEHFSSYGKVAEHQIMLDHSTGRSRGFGFVTFESEDAVERVMSEGRMHDLGGKQVEIKKAEPKKPGGGDSSSNGRYSHGSGGYRGSHRGSGGGSGSGSSGSSGGSGYRSGAAAYYGSTAYAGYGRGYGYGGNAGYGSGFGAGYGGSMYGGPYGAYGGYGSAYGGGAYGAPGGYGAGGYGAYGGARGYGAYGGAGGMGGGSTGGRGSSRYHPYGK